MCYLFYLKILTGRPVRKLQKVPFVCVQETAKRIARVSKEAKLEIDEETYVESFRPHMMDIVYEWCNGCPFSKICKMTDIFEGGSPLDDYL